MDVGTLLLDQMRFAEVPTMICATLANIPDCPSLIEMSKQLRLELRVNAYLVLLCNPGRGHKLASANSAWKSFQWSHLY